MIGVQFKGKKTLLGKKNPKKDTSVFTSEKKVTSVHQKSPLSEKCHFCRKNVTSVYIGNAFSRETQITAEKVTSISEKSLLSFN